MQQPQAMPYGFRRPANHLAWAILATVLCCMPLGVVSIVYSAQVDSKWSVGDIAGAERSSRLARNWAIASAVAVAVGVVAYLAFVAVMISSGAAA